MPHESEYEGNQESNHDEVDSQDMEHIQAFVDGCDPSELEYLRSCLDAKMEDMMSDSESEEEVKPKKTLKKETEYSIGDTL